MNANVFYLDQPYAFVLQVLALGPLEAANPACIFTWEIQKNRTKVRGIRFIAFTDCFALQFILSYDGPNPVFLRLQMQFQLWAIDLYHTTMK